MSEKFDPKEFPVDEKDIQDTKLFNKIAIAQTVFRQLERCNQAALISEEAFAASVRILMTLVPKDRKNEILERSDEFTSTTKSYQYKMNCGCPIGTIEHPILGSPFVVEEEVIDWYVVYEICLGIFQDLGLTWKEETWTREAGKVQEKKVPPAETDTVRPTKPDHW